MHTWKGVAKMVRDKNEAYIQAAEYIREVVRLRDKYWAGAYLTDYPSKIPCGDVWQDCSYFDPDVCLDESKCVLEDAVLWDEDYDSDTEYNYVYADMMLY